MEAASIMKQFPELTQGADHVDVKTGTGAVTLLAMVAGILSYRPGWMAVLWQIRVWLLRALGQGEKAVPDEERFSAETLPVKPGEMAGFFAVTDSDGETYWMAEGKESHLECVLAVFAEPDSASGPGMRRFHIMTVVRYRSWVGPVYFNIIRPFHHLVVHFAMRSVLGEK